MNELLPTYLTLFIVLIFIIGIILLLKSPSITPKEDKDSSVNKSDTSAL